MATQRCSNVVQLIKGENNEYVKRDRDSLLFYKFSF